MKFTILSFILLFTLTAQAQITPYIAIVKTSYGKQKGILRHVSSNALGIEQGDSVLLIKAIDIRQIVIKASRKPYEYKNVFTYKPWDESNFDNVSGSQVPVRKFGAQDPTPNQEIAGHVNTVVMNAAVNLIAAPFHSINGSIDKIQINQQAENFSANRDALAAYSIYYQTHPDPAAELKKIKAISEVSPAQK